MRVYPRYRDSGVEWLGEMPVHWNVRRLKDVGRLIAGAAFPEALQGVAGEELPFFKVGDLHKSADGRWLHDTEHTISRETAAELRAQVVPQETVVYAKIGAALLLNRRRITTRPACIDNNMSAYVPHRDRVTTHWALYALSLLDFGEHVNSGAVPSLSEGDQAILPIPLPPLDEQRAIAAYLDGETERIDALVAKKHLLIERLEEYRTALMTRTVTHGLPPEAASAAGLDPSPRFKPSGVEWLGEVPEHWEVKPLHALTQAHRPIIYGIVLPGPHVEGGVPIVKGGDVRERVAAGFVSSNTTAELDAAHSRSRLVAGDLVFAIRGSVGDVAEVPAPLQGANMTQDAARISAIPGTSATWLRYFLASDLTKAQVQANTLGATISGINIRDLRRVLVPTPPEHEQDAIATHLTWVLGRLSGLEDRVATAIQRLQEHRTALITAAVTGKIDVRESNTRARRAAGTSSP